MKVWVGVETASLYEVMPIRMSLRAHTTYEVLKSGLRRYGDGTLVCAPVLI
jgi:hypothetical protein